MAVIVPDTSVWIDLFGGESIPLLQEAIKESRVLLSPIVFAELVSGVKNERERVALIDSMSSLHVFEADIAHWTRVGDLRNHLRKKGLNITIPDSHIAQCAIDRDAQLLTRDSIFKKIAPHTTLKLCEV